MRGETSPSYTAPCHPELAAVLAATVPEARLIYMVRDRVERAIPHYLHARASGREQWRLDAALRDFRGAYVARSLYYPLRRERGGRPGLIRRLEATRLREIGYRLPEDAKWLIERLVSPAAAGRLVCRGLIPTSTRSLPHT